MDASVIARRRRPFLMPIWAMALFVLVPVAAALAVYRSATTTTVVITRHAEKVLGTIADPPLTPEGERRAEQLARMFGSAGTVGQLDAVFVSDTRRAQQTAAPLIARLGTRPIVLPARDIDAITHEILEKHRGKSVLVVGHSNTVPDLIRKLSGIEIAAIADEDYENLYIVSVPSVGSASVLQFRY